MASFPTPEPSHFASFDGVVLAWREIGEGRPLVLIHGLFSNGVVNWLKFGTAQMIAEAGHRVILPDLRAHGDSAAPRDPAAYPPDVLAKDQEALIAHLGLADYDLGGFSLGARTTMRLLARGSRPRRAIIAGMGLAGLTDHAPRSRWFLDVIARRDSIERGTDEWFAVQFMRSNRIDPEAASLLLKSQVDTPADTIARIDVPTLVVCGTDDCDNGSAQQVGDLLPNAIYRAIPGTHMSSVTKPDFGRAIVDFLAWDSLSRKRDKGD